ncbi:MAG: glycosyltransferase family 9 protein [Desulfocapsa sp.]|nr:glycosyltransferase family 9 protein [Desulfocapsa sp.]
MNQSMKLLSTFCSIETEDTEAEISLSSQRILIIKQSSLGDIIHTLPLVHALKRSYPGISIAWVVQKAFASIVERDDNVDKVFVIDIPSTSEPSAKKSAFFKAMTSTLGAFSELRKAFVEDPYDFVLDLHASFRSGVFSFCNPGGVRIGFSDAKELNTFFQRHLVQVPQKLIHAQDKNLLFAPFLGCTVEDEDFFLQSNDEDQEAVTRIIEGETKRLVYFNPVGRWESKFWPLDRWAALGDRLQGEENVRVVLAGSNYDRPVLENIAKLMETDPLITGGKLSLIESAALIKQSSLYIGVDSGPMHMAALAGIPVVALFGPTDPRLVGPYKVLSKVVRNETLDCLVCRKRNCEELTCMYSISVEQVFKEAQILL